MLKGLSKTKIAFKKFTPKKNIFNKKILLPNAFKESTIICDSITNTTLLHVNTYVKESWPNESEMGITWEDLMKTKDVTEEEKKKSPLFPTDSDEDQRITSYFPVRGICPGSEPIFFSA